MTRYNKNPKLDLQRGRQPKVTKEIKERIVAKFELTPECTLKEGSDLFGLSKSVIGKTHNDENNYYFQKILVPSLRNLHLQNRIIFSRFISSFHPNFHPQIIITDESTVMDDFDKGGIWRKRGYYPSGSFYTHDKHITSVMVWDGIGLGGYKTKLIRCPKRMNS